LTKWIVSLPLFQWDGLILVMALCLLGVVLSTIVSNTATANLLIPVAMSIAGENQVMLAIAIALSCSVAMALPVSTPPNAIAFSTNAIRSRDMFRSGIMISFVSMVLVLSGVRFVVVQVFGME